MSHRRPHAFTIVELIVATAVFAGVTVALMTFSSTAMRLFARNLSVNHSHDSIRIADQAMLRDLHDAASGFRLMTFNGTTYTDISPAATTDVDKLTQKFVSARGNAVRFRRLAGGPFKMTAATTPDSIDLTFDFSGGGYTPQVGDKIVLPLIAREFGIIAVPSAGVVRISDAGGIGFTINVTSPPAPTPPVTTAYFYREVAYSVWGGALRYHKNFTSTNKTSFVQVRDKITSTQPFGLLYPTATGQVENGALRVSLEAYDPNYTGRRFANGTATLQAIIPPMNVPTPVSATDYTP